MHKYLLVGMGGFAGAIARYGVGTFVTQRMGLRFPFGTFLINVSGCFLIGFFMHLLAERGVLDAHWLYVVVNCKTKPELYLIQDPGSKLSPKEEVSVVRYMIGQKEWKDVASSVQ